MAVSINDNFDFPTLVGTPKSGGDFHSHRTVQNYALTLSRHGWFSLRKHALFALCVPCCRQFSAANREGLICVHVCGIGRGTKLLGNSATVAHTLVNLTVACKRVVIVPLMSFVPMWGWISTPPKCNNLDPPSVRMA